jgi:formylglycine-generating enzyme required for sulfatase activity
MQLRTAGLAVGLFAVILFAAASAKCGSGAVDVQLKTSASANAPDGEKITLYQKSKALVIGMDRYDGRSWPQLSNGIKDAEEVAKALKAQGFEVTLLKDLKSADLDAALRQFFYFDGAEADARLLLWFAGHGDTIGDEAYLVPVDAPSPNLDAEFRSKAISLRRFGEYMREAKAKHVLAIFDSCFSGSVFNVARSVPPPAITLATTESVREFISSGEADQSVSDDGMFRKLFLDVLAGKETDADANHDGYVTGTELGLFLHQKMTNLSGNRQTPRYGKLNALGYDRGDFVFQIGKPLVVATATSTQTQTSSEAERAWAQAKDTDSTAILEAFIRSYGDSFYGALARTRLEEVKKRQVAAAMPTPITDGSAGCGSTPLTVSWSSRSPKPLSKGEECALKAKDLFQECDQCPEMVVVPAGSFTMGSPSSEPERTNAEGPQHKVTIAKPFAVGRFSVTFDEWDACVAEGSCNNYKPSDAGWGRGRRPVINVSWDDAKSYVTWLSRKTGKSYRLLSESEREYVTRAGTTTPFWWGSSISTNQANYDGNYTYGSGAKGEYRRRTLPVDSFERNPWGLYQVHGNVWEWTEDCYHDNYDGAPSDGSAWTSGECKYRVLRGGSWLNYPRNLRAADRYWFTSAYRYGNYGFRLERTLSQ